MQKSVRESIHAVHDIFINVKQYVIQQIAQVELLIKNSKEQDKVIFCGDFNTLPSSFIYSRVTADFKNAFEKAGSGFGFTYLGKTLFFLRIDNQFYSGNGMKCIGFKEIDFGFSDHRATMGKYIVE